MIWLLIVGLCSFDEVVRTDLVAHAKIRWSRIDSGACNCLGFATVPTFWWQLGGVSTLAALALFAGWLQGQWHYQPPEIQIEPPAAEPGHDPAHGHH